MAFAGLALMLSTAACSDADYDEKYADPSSTSTVNVPLVFTGVMEAGNTWMNPVYYRYYTQSTTSGVFSGVIGESNGRGRFRGASEGYFNTSVCWNILSTIFLTRKSLLMLYSIIWDAL